MKNGSHSRHTTRFDKFPTVRLEHPNLEERVADRIGVPVEKMRGTSAQRQTVKKLQKRKQRQHDKKLAKEGCPVHGLDTCTRCSVQAIIFGDN